MNKTAKNPLSSQSETLRPPSLGTSLHTLIVIRNLVATLEMNVSESQKTLIQTPNIDADTQTEEQTEE